MDLWRRQGEAAAALARRLATNDASNQAQLRAALASFDPQLTGLGDEQLAKTAALLACGGRLIGGPRWSQLTNAVAIAPVVPMDEQQRDPPADPRLGWEQLQAGFDAASRRQRGAFFTPPPLADFVARAALTQLGQFGDDARSRLLAVDPAAGSGIFLGSLLDRAAWLRPEQLLGWECDPATAAAANALLASRLPDWANVVRWGDALQQQDHRDWRAPQNGVGEPVLMVIGNPPYSNFGSGNDSAWTRELLQRYKRGLNERKQNLDDDFVKFFCWAEHHVRQAGRGILALVTSSTYLRGLTHRLMRSSLLSTFDEAWLLDLHGEQFNRAGDDENVFDVRAGVAVSVMVRRQGGGGCQVRHAELRGRRQAKLAALASPWEQLPWRQLHPAEPDWLLSPQTADDQQYQRWPALDELLPCHISGVQTKRDALFIDRCPDRLARRMRIAIDDPDGSRAPAWLAERLRRADYNSQHIRAVLVAPFDRRWLYYDPALLGRSRYSVMRHVCVGGRGLAFMRQSTNEGDYDHFLACPAPATDRVFHSRHGAPYIAPWWVCEGERRTPNLSFAAWELSGRDGLGPPPAATLDYIYAIVHSGAYRRRFGERLRRGFPRIPPAPDRRQFEQLAELGAELADLHCAERTATQIQPPGDGRIDRACPKVIGARGEQTEIRLSREHTWQLPTAAWNWRVGGVPVIQRWLKSRRDEPLSSAERQRLPELAQVALETQQLCQQIEAATQWLVETG